MKRRSLFTLLALSFVFTAACGKKVTVDELEKLKKEACACRDAACAKQLQKKLEDKLGDATTDDLGQEGTSVTMDIAMCLAKAEAGLHDLGK